jgi:hypothetical protein
MKKILLIAMVMCIAIPALAVDIDLVDNADGTGTITYTAGANEVLRGLALKVTLTGGTLVEDPAEIGATSINPEFNVYMDSAWFLEQDGEAGYNVGDGTPLADADEKGPLDPIAGATSFSICMGVVDNEEPYEQAGAAGDGTYALLTIKVDAETVVTIEADGLRGGIVGDELGTDDIEGGTITLPLLVCMKDTHPDHAVWESYGSPDCWCFAKQCNGDIDGKTQFSGFVDVYTDDLDIFVPAYGLLNTTEPAVCADIDHGTQFSGFVNVYTDDLDIFVPAYGLLVAECDDTHINFWIVPE